MFETAEAMTEDKINADKQLKELQSELAALLSQLVEQGQLAVNMKKEYSKLQADQDSSIAQNAYLQGYIAQLLYTLADVEQRNRELQVS